MGIYLKAEGSPDINSPDYIGTFGNSQSRPVLRLLTTIADDEVVDDRIRQEMDETNRFLIAIEYIKKLNAELPQDAPGIRQALRDAAYEDIDDPYYDDDSLLRIRKFIERAAQNGQDIVVT